MPRIELSAGPIDYVDTGGDGPVIVLTHGLAMDGRQWERVLPHLTGYRVVLPTLPLGAHRVPMKPDADLSQRGVALILGEFLEALDLTDVTLAFNDWGGAQFVLTEPAGCRVGRVAFVACEAFDNFPPRPARPLVLLCSLPGGTWLLSRLFATSFFRHHHLMWGAMTVGRLPDDLMDHWFAPVRASREIRRDLRKFATGAPGADALLRWSERLRDVRVPALVVWAADDRMMPAEHGPRLAGLLPNARLVVVDGSATLVPLDRPDALAGVLLEFLAANGTPPVGT